MKFAKNLARNQVPEWSAEYIDYKGLKKLIKSAAEERDQGREADLAGFFFSLDRNLEDVDGFYNKKFGDVFRQLKLLNERFGNDKSVLDGTNRDEIDDITAILLDLRSQLRKLQWYGEVNRRGFIKITKKLDKRIATACAQQQYLQTRVDPRPFATNAALSKAMNGINTWLSRLSEVQTLDDASSTRSSVSLTRGPNAIASLPNELLDDLERAIREDNPIALDAAMDEMQEYEAKQTVPFQKAAINLLQKAINIHSKKCISTLLKLVPDLNEDDDFSGRNCIHRLVITIARPSREEEQALEAEQAGNFIVPAEAPTMFPLRARGDKEVDNLHEDRLALVLVLKHFLDCLTTAQKPALVLRDKQGRMPLHYAAQLGSVTLSELLLRRMLDWKQFDPAEGVDPKAWEDNEGNTPLHLSVMEGHPQTTNTLLRTCIEETSKGLSNGSGATPRAVIHNSSLLAGATKRNFVRVVKLLCEAGADLNEQDGDGETALHIAARFGHLECARALVNGSSWHQINLEIGEKTFGWTPLLVASVDGHLDLVQFFVDIGARVDTVDASGWTAKEHAALRGHLDIAGLLNKHTTRLSSVDGLPRSPRVKPTDPSPLEDRSSKVTNGQNGTSKSSVGIKSFGHRYLTNESLVLVSLGSMDNRKHVDPVKLDTIPIKDAHATQLDTALSIIVSAAGATGEPTTIDLPVQENISTEPVAFHTTDPSKVKILFDIIPTYSGAKDKVIGRGVALLSHVKTMVGTKKMNLQGDITVPIVAAKTLDYIGSVNFNFLIVTPFEHPNMSINESQTYWKRLTAPMVIGHRGLGKNLGTRNSLQLGENTMQSFIAAANLGASYVEFDVQLTKDRVPVIYHDFLVSETGIDAPVHTLTLEQFMHVNESSNGSGRATSPARSFRDRMNSDGNDGGRPSIRASRANSVGGLTDSRREDMSEKMKHTRDFKMKGFKGNSRGSSIQAPFTTLEEMLKKLPETIGFNIEMKYPMLFETEEAEMDTYAFELNSFVDTVLTKVYDLCNNRDIIFSSFNPDICLLLSFKQPSIPVLFLTDAGASPVGDIRASSLQEAIRFASRWNLLGIVSASQPFVFCPRLVKVVKESGLVCVSYGSQNNDPENVKLQVKEGIDAVIVDSVLAIRKGLTHDDNPESAKGLDRLLPVNGVAINGSASSLHPSKSPEVVPLP